MIVVLHQGKVLDNKLFLTPERARNYVAMNYPRDWEKTESFMSFYKPLLEKNGAFDIMKCKQHGSTFLFVYLEDHEDGLNSTT